MKVLLVEDDPKLAKVVQQGLRENGFDVALATGAAEALARACGADFDAIILDVLLPDGNGLDVLKELRRRKEGVPVLILSARSATDDRIRGLNLGADDYLAKPFDFRELLARLRALSRRSGTTAEGVLRAADLELDSGAHVVRRAGRPVELTSREFALLEYLLRHKNKVVTRSMILARVWDSDYEGASNIVDVYVNYLRRKIDQDHGLRLLQTIRGTGYVLRDSP